MSGVAEFLWSPLFFILFNYLAVLGLAACGIQFPEQGMNPGPMHWECGVLATGPPGKSLWLPLITNLYFLNLWMHVFCTFKKACSDFFLNCTWDPPRLGTELQGRLRTTGPPGKPCPTPFYPLGLSSDATNSYHHILFNSIRALTAISSFLVFLTGIQVSQRHVP